MEILAIVCSAAGHKKSNYINENCSSPSWFNGEFNELKRLYRNAAINVTVSQGPYNFDAAPATAPGRGNNVAPASATKMIRFLVLRM
jgi:hypothetical protein